MDNNKLFSYFSKIEQNSLISGIRDGLIMNVPILLVGSFSLIIKTFVSDVSASSLFLEIIYWLSSFLYDATFGILSIFMAFFICYNIIQKKELDVYFYSAPIAAVAGLIILSGGLEAGIASNSFNVSGMFTAIFSALMSSVLYFRLSLFFHKNRTLSYGGGYLLQNVMNTLLPFAGTLLSFAIFNQLIRIVFQVDSFQNLFVSITNGIFVNMGRGLFSGTVFIFISSFLWFFGIHGSDVLEHVMQTIFVPAIDENAALVAAGQAPTEIFSKCFFDTFVLMGGCGATLTLLISLLLFSKNSGNRSLSKIAALPMLFNVNEMMVFGLPIVFNPIFIIPFLLTPLLCVFTSTLALEIGLVPIPYHHVEWTTPILISGYLTTGSFAGSILQLFNLLLGILIYRPFVLMYDKFQTENAKLKIQQLTTLFKRTEESGKSLILTAQNNDMGLAAKHLAFELRQELHDKKLKLYYQPQFNEKDECIGVEALLRWIHPLYGVIYPPLIIQLAREMDFLMDLEKYVFSYVFSDSEELYKVLGKHTHISLNITPESVQKKEFMIFLNSLAHAPGFVPNNFCIEVTEQMQLDSGDHVKETFEKIRELGFLLAIDDFSMGSTSIKYLQNNQFSLIKLDGGLVRNLECDPNAREIILSIISLSHALHIHVLAEYTENRSLQKALQAIGCLQYQGYFYSPAIPLEKLQATVEECKQLP